ncbi:MAG: phosphate ABC transporter permease PstA [Oscillospiraceae bacterium]|nr:phosphate ABC transporter permease PstA [Oscillospiraceae bacterium]
MVKSKGYLRSRLQKGLVLLSAVLVLGVLIALVAYILIKGVPHLRAGLFAWNYSTENLSLLPALLNTLSTVLLTLFLAVPAGVGGAVYLVEYAPRGSRGVKLIRTMAETLSGIPSIVYGLFGFLLFVLTCSLGYSLLSGALTLAIMVLPTILRTTEEALLAVPDSYREGSFGLGAGKLRTIFRIVLPAAMSGISSGIVLATGRIVGETAALIYTAGTVTGRAGSLMESGRTLAIHLYCLLNEGFYMDEAYATAVVLLFLVVGINFLAGLLARGLAKR